jgi:hypothetical protein
VSNSAELWKLCRCLVGTAVRCRGAGEKAAVALKDAGDCDLKAPPRGTGPGPMRAGGPYCNTDLVIDCCCRLQPGPGTGPGVKSASLKLVHSTVQIGYNPTALDPGFRVQKRAMPSL